MLAQLTDEHEPDDGWSNVRSRRRKKITKKGITDEMPELNAVHDVNRREDHSHQRLGSGGVSSAQGHGAERATERKSARASSTE